ncbi:MAG: hypothetical protein NHF89_01045 [Candidatus Shikimatogenerans bostrichidophilus]|nr:MAG: hypothetical protein NHF89_01045 [Candidatus Shikimatogenerans bostrichidophilus]
MNIYINKKIYNFSLKEKLKLNYLNGKNIKFKINLFIFLKTIFYINSYNIIIKINKNSKKILIKEDNNNNIYVVIMNII